MKTTHPITKETRRGFQVIVCKVRNKPTRESKKKIAQARDIYREIARMGGETATRNSAMTDFLAKHPSITYRH